MLRDHLAPRLIGRDPSQIERLWRELLFATHATSVGAITSLALAAIDTALWDWRCRRDGQPLWRAAGGAQPDIAVYTTEGGWLHHTVDSLVNESVAAKEAGFLGAKIKKRCAAQRSSGRCRAHRRHHAVAEGGAPGRNLDAIVDGRVQIAGGRATPPETPGLGIAWKWAEIEKRAVARHRVA